MVVSNFFISYRLAILNEIYVKIKKWQELNLLLYKIEYFIDVSATNKIDNNSHVSVTFKFFLLLQITNYNVDIDMLGAWPVVGYKQ